MTFLGSSWPLQSVLLVFGKVQQFSCLKLLSTHLNLDLNCSFMLLNQHVEARCL